MQVIADIAPLREQILQWRREKQRIAFIPTMGNLHDEHLALIRKARENADTVVVSIFVNPLQFEKTDDFAAYPRTLENDLSLLNSEGVELLFTPSVDLMHPNGLDQNTFVDVSGLSGIVEGSSRPGHFKNITTSLNKLFNLIQPDVACFSEKNYQKLVIINKMISDLCLPIEIISVPTIREMDGLAISRNNTHLTVDERQRAPVLSKTLRWISAQMRAGRNDYSELVIDGKDQLRAAGLEPDEIFIRDAYTLQPIVEQTPKAVILATAILGQVRLIDNLTVDLSPQLNDGADT